MISRNSKILEKLKYRVKVTTALMTVFLFFFFTLSEDWELSILGICYFGIFEVAFNGKKGEKLVLHKLNSVFEREKIQDARPDRSLKEFEGGDRP